MITINDQFWNIAAAGLIVTLLNKIISTTNSSSNPDRAAREVLHTQHNAYKGWFTVQCQETLKYVPSESAITKVFQQLDLLDLAYNPQLKTDLVPSPTNAAVSGGDTLGADPAIADHEIHVFSWDFTVFTHLGELSANNQPGAGNYVLAQIETVNYNVITVSENHWSLPTVFLTTTS